MGSGSPKSWQRERAMADIRGMFKPVRCRCGGIYDLGEVKVTARYLDCSVWNAPCCGRTSDDRGETGWKSFSDYTVLDKNDPNTWGVRLRMSGDWWEGDG